MKAINIDGTIKTYNSVPKTWGNILGVQYLDDSSLQELGFYDVVIPTTENSEKLGSIEWNADDSVFTYPVINKTWSETLAQLKEGKIKSLKSIYNLQLSKTDWYIVRAQEGIAAPQDVIDARAALRTECATKEVEINALTTKKAVVSYSINIS